MLHESHQQKKKIISQFRKQFNLLLLYFQNEMHESQMDFSVVKLIASKILSTCKFRNDNWAFRVCEQVEYFGQDFHAADCIYHHIKIVIQILIQIFKRHEIFLYIGLEINHVAAKREKLDAQ